MATASSTVATRDIFAANLKDLIASYPSVSHVSRELGINRAQLNRYLNGESHPRPDALKNICEFFGTDARILVAPLAELAPLQTSLIQHPEIRDFTMAGQKHVDETTLPSGFYRVSRRSFFYPEKYVLNLLFVYRKEDWTFVKGYEARQTVRDQGLSMSGLTRQFRGYVFRTDDGFSAMISRLGAITCTFNYFTPVMSFNHNFWQGYTARTEAEMIGSSRFSRTALEFLDGNTSEILKTARRCGLCDEQDLLPFHKRLLKPDTAFA